MKFVLCTTPIRPVPTDYPPVGSTSLLETLLSAGYDPKFYDIDALRPSFESVLEFFRREKPDILGISAVVSTAYRYTKELTHAVKAISPQTRIILGGNLAASSEILLRKCPIDLTVVGEGEKVLLNVVRHWERFGDFAPRPELEQIKGIAFLNADGDMVFTGYETALAQQELRQPNYELLEKHSDIDRFLPDPLNLAGFAADPRSYQPHRIGKKSAIVLTSKGCVARCTFCHRWDKGYRTYPLDPLFDTIKYLRERWNVGFFRIADENFGSDRRYTEELIDRIKPLDVLFEVAGVRVATVDNHPQIIRKLKEAGCCGMYFGMESGSPKMLSVMEKKARAEQNLRVAKLLNKEGMYTIIQLVLGMPGENNETIEETVRFTREATEDMKEMPLGRLSINLFQSLPGTPGYEFMRAKGLLGSTLEEEEAYLLKISDIDASSPRHYINVSEAPLEDVLLWQSRIAREAMIHFCKKRGWKPVPPAFEGWEPGMKDYARGGYFRILQFRLRNSVWRWRIEDIFRGPFRVLRHFKNRVRIHGFWKGLALQFGLLPTEDRSAFIISEPKSLRKIVQLPNRETISLSEASMIPLRAGR